MQDAFANHSDMVLAPSRHSVVLTPNDGAYLAALAKGIYAAPAVT